VVVDLVVFPSPSQEIPSLVLVVYLLEQNEMVVELVDLVVLSVAEAEALVDILVMAERVEHTALAAILALAAAAVEAVLIIITHKIMVVVE